MLSSNCRRYVEDQSVADSELHLALTVSDVPDAFDFICKFSICRQYSDRNAIEVAWTNESGSIGDHDGLADRAINACVFKVLEYENWIAAGYLCINILALHER